MTSILGEEYEVIALNPAQHGVPSPMPGTVGYGPATLDVRDVHSGRVAKGVRPYKPGLKIQVGTRGRLVEGGGGLFYPVGAVEA